MNKNDRKRLLDIADRLSVCAAELQEIAESLEERADNIESTGIENPLIETLNEEADDVWDFQHEAGALQIEIDEYVEEHS